MEREERLERRVEMFLLKRVRPEGERARLARVAVGVEML